VKSLLTTSSRLHHGEFVGIVTGRGSASRAVLLPAVGRLRTGPMRVFVPDFSVSVDEGSFLVLLK